MKKKEAKNEREGGEQKKMLKRGEKEVKNQKGRKRNQKLEREEKKLERRKKILTYCTNWYKDRERH